MTYWTWLFKGYNAKSGISKFLDFWLVVHIWIGILCALLFHDELKVIAEKMFLPVAGVLVGAIFKYVTDLQKNLESEEIKKLYKHHPDGKSNYIYTQMTALLVIFVCLIMWGFLANASFGELNIKWKFLLKEFAFFFSSLALREFWTLITMSSQLAAISSQINSGNSNNA